MEIKRNKTGPYIITICGSFRFLPFLIKAHHELSRQGFMVFLPDFPVDGDIPTGSTEFDEEAQKLQDAKISFGDAIFICNVGGYIGESTAYEYRLARRLGKDVFWLESNEESLNITRENLRKYDPKLNKKGEK